MFSFLRSSAQPERLREGLLLLPAQLLPTAEPGEDGPGGCLPRPAEKGRCWMRQKNQVIWPFSQSRVGAGGVKKERKKKRLPGRFHREGLVLNEGCNKDEVICPVPQRTVHVRDSTKTRLSGLFHREGSMLETAQRPGYMVCSTEKGPC